MIYLATDHAGFDLMQEIVKHLDQNNVDYNYVGAKTFDSLDSYVDFTHLASAQIKKQDMGIFICGTGIGTSIVANRYSHIRAALCHNIEFAKLARQHNNANVLVLPGRFIEVEDALNIVDKFLNTEFEGGRHQQRIDKINC